jgi:hypothetical protein
VKTYRLVAIETNRTGAAQLTALRNALGPAMQSHEIGTMDISGKPRRTHTFTLDSALMRNTVAHGYGFQCGYLVHIES